MASHKSLRMAVLVVAMMASPLPAKASQYVVIRSSDPALARGSILPGGTELRLSEGAAVTLIDDAGKPLTIKGPYAGAVGERGKAKDKAAKAAKGKGLLASLSRLVGSDERGRTSLGSIRGVTAGGEAPDPWAVNVARAGTYCLRPGTLPRLWRERTGSRKRLVVGDHLFGIEKKVAWEKGQAYTGWPDGLEIRQDRVYLVQPQGKLIATRVDFRFLPESAATPGEVIVWMADNGCDVQAQLLIESLK